MSRLLSKLAQAKPNIAVNNLFGASFITRLASRNFSSKTATVTIPKAVQHQYLSLASNPATIHRFPIFDQETLARGSLELKSLLSRQARLEGCKDSDLIIKALEGFASTEYNSIYFTNSVPAHELRAPNLRINLSRNVATDAKPTPNSIDPKELITENFPNFLFLAHCLAICGLRAHDSISSTKVSPFTIVSQSHNQAAHCDGVSSLYGVDAISLSAISSKGETATFIIDLEYILSKLSPDAIKTLSTTIFRAQGQLGEGFSASKDIRILEQDSEGKMTIHYSQSLECTTPSTKVSQALSELHSAISSNFEERLTKFYLKTGENLIFDNKRLVHGRVNPPLETGGAPSAKSERTIGISVYTKSPQQEI